MQKIDFKKAIKTVANGWNTPPKGRFLNFKEIGTFGLYAMGNSCICSAIWYVVTISQLPYLYGIADIHGYLIITLGSFLNMLLQPVVGKFMEKTNTKWGRYKPYILFTLPFLMVFGVLSTFSPQFASETARTVFAYVICVPTLVLLTFSQNMFQTMPSVITPVSQERADIMTPIGLLVGFAPSIMQIIAGPIRAYYNGIQVGPNGSMEYMGLRIIGIISAVIGGLLVLLILRVRERVFTLEKDENQEEEQIGFWQALSLMTKNKPLIILFIALCVGSLREFCKQFFYFMIQFRFASSVQDGMTMSGLILTVVGFASTVAMFLLPIVTRKMSKHHAIMLFTAFGVLSYGFLGIYGMQNLAIGTQSSITITILFFIAAVNPTYLIIPMMLGEIADYQQNKTGKRLEGNLQNLLFTIPALVSNIFMIIAWIVQKKVGYNGAELAISTAAELIAKEGIITNWFNITNIISAVSGILMIGVLCFYPLTKKKYKEVLAELESKSVITLDSTSVLAKSIEDKADQDASNPNAMGKNSFIANEDVLVINEDLNVDNADGTVESTKGEKFTKKEVAEFVESNEEFTTEIESSEEAKTLDEDNK